MLYLLELWYNNAFEWSVLWKGNYSLNENRYFIDPYPYHPWKLDCLPLENYLSNSQVTKRLQHRSCAGKSSEQVCTKVLCVAKE